MDSSQTNPKLLISKPSSSSSPTHQESSLFSFLETLSPIGSVEATKYSQRYPLINFSSPSPVFTSPRMDLQRRNSFFKREDSNAENDAKKEENNDLVSSLDKGKKSHESPVSIEKYLAFESSSAMKEINGTEGGDCDAGDVEGENTPHSASAKQIDIQRLNQIIKSVSGALDDRDVFLNSLNEAELDEQLVIQHGLNHQQNICRHLQFEDAMNHKDTYNEFGDNSNLGLVSNLRSSESLVHPLVESTESCVSSGLQCPLSLSIGSKDKQMHERRNRSLSKNFDTVSAGKSHFQGEDDQKENLAIVVAGSNTPQSADSMHHRGDSSCVYGFKQLVASRENVQNSNIGKDLYKLSSKKDRKKAKFSSENEGCKRCNCKRSQCLKLYCDCFASGVYCVDTCACENCYNKPEFEDTVLDMRQKIENRNPLAFAPKVVKHPTKSPANTMEPNWATPSSARHKRGCNCKRSKCLKKYCECYQAGVGCSDGCRCEDCSNSFGKKTELIYRSRANGLVTPTYVLADITNLSPIPHSHTGIISSSALRASQVDPNQGSNVHTLTGYLGFNNSPANHSPKLCGNKGLAELSSVSPDSFLFSKWKENVSPDIINNISTSVSPNQKQQLSSRSPSGLRSRRKFILRNVSPFPPLTPFSSSKGGGMHKNESSSQ